MTATCCNPVADATARVLTVRCPRHAVTVATGDCAWFPALPPRFPAPASVVCNHAPTDPAPVQPNAAASRQPPPSSARPTTCGPSDPSEYDWESSHARVPCRRHHPSCRRLLPLPLSWPWPSVRPRPAASTSSATNRTRRRLRSKQSEEPSPPNLAVP